MDPAMPDWRAFGQPAAAAPVMPADPPPRPTSGSPLASLVGLSRSTLLALALAGAIAVGGIVLAVVTPGGGGLVLEDGVGPAGDAAAAGVTDVAEPGSLPWASAGSVGVGELIVDVAGAVGRPGLVRLAAGSRVGDAVAAAGGYASAADLEAVARTLNLAAPVADGMKVLVPSLADAARAGADDSDPAAGAEDGARRRVDLNTAAQDELEALPGIGPVTAGRIIEARGEARFTEVEELRARGLVGQAVFDRLRDLITVRR